MQLIDELRAEHDLIEQVAGAFRTFARQRARGEGDAIDGPRFLAFFRLYAGRFHHGREEDTLFVSLQKDAELPGDRGPIAVLLGDHHRMGAILDRLEPIVAGDPAAPEVTTLALDYTEQLWHHIDAENSVLLPESEHRLRRHGVRELPSRALAADEAEAMETGRTLLARYPPVHEPDVLRGDGCVMCPAFVDDCEGVERAWWNEHEWDELDDHLASG
jgi:hemerythrin-like domain-containing protein